MLSVILWATSFIVVDLQKGSWQEEIMREAMMDFRQLTRYFDADGTTAGVLRFHQKAQQLYDDIEAALHAARDYFVSHRDTADVESATLDHGEQQMIIRGKEGNFTYPDDVIDDEPVHMLSTFTASLWKIVGSTFLFGLDTADAAFLATTQEDAPIDDDDENIIQSESGGAVILSAYRSVGHLENIFTYYPTTTDELIAVRDGLRQLVSKL